MDTMKFYSMLKNGMTFTLTEKDITPGDHFLIFSAYKEITFTIYINRVPFKIDFEHDEPILIENCPISFINTIIANIKKGNYTIKK
jgi:hypothetical protein